MLPTTTTLFYQNNATIPMVRTEDAPLDRFHRQAPKEQHVNDECIISLHGNLYNLTAWANAHPGGVKVLQKFHKSQADATKAFEAAHHSQAAYDMLREFAVVDGGINTMNDHYAPSVPSPSPETAASTVSKSLAACPFPGIKAPAKSNVMKNPRLGYSAPVLRSRLKRKLFTKEDPIGIHKYLGVFVLLNYAGRYRQAYFGDVCAGLGSRGHPWFALACLIPHALLSASSLIFHTVPKERVVGKPMIWQEFRVHNILFGLRSVVTAMAASLSIAHGNTPLARQVAISVSCLVVLMSQWGANVATNRLRPNQVESTTATMPYWEGCSMETQRRFKSFYAYSQFMATLACLAVGNPFWPLSVLLAIQCASLLMTLVRKGLLSTRGYHYGYTATLLAPYLVGVRSMMYTRRPDFPIMVMLGYLLYQARRRGVNKFVLWLPIVMVRWTIGDAFLTNPSVW
jgi:Cytochrome b5-like Heme/Steroid binding domain